MGGCCVEDQHLVVGGWVGGRVGGCCVEDQHQVVGGCASGWVDVGLAGCVKEHTLVGGGGWLG